MSAFIGIDLGTTFSAVATLDQSGRPVIIHNEDGENITPSCVAESSPGAFFVGEEARRTWGIAPTEAAARFKRDMGSSVTHKINNHSFTPTELSAFVLKKLRTVAENSKGSIGEAVITIPANFSNEAREATMSAAKSVGLNVNYIINEPTAAALYYAFDNGQDLSGTYAIYDLGGGTFDVSIIKVSGQDIDVIASNGVSKLGGDDFDEAIKRIVSRKYHDLTGDTLEEDDYTSNDAEEDKKSLSRRQEVKARANRKLISVSRQEFENEISGLVTQAEMLCEATLDEADVEPEDIKAVFLAGGSTRIPIILESIKRVFEQEPIATANVDEVVAQGAALYAAYKGDKSNLSQAQKNSIEKINVSESTNKCFGTLIFTYDEERGQEKTVNTTLIEKGDQIPCSVTKTFYTVVDNQTSVNCELTETTSPETDPKFAKVIWNGELSLPSGRPAGQEIKVTYSYDDNQMMKCSFVDVGTGRKTEVDMSFSNSKNDTEVLDINNFLVE
ncbi:Hsp70 family protein [Vibrio breoganii]